jgi:hypothetical protein
VIPLICSLPLHLCNSRYLDQIAQHTEEKLDKHRFLVQSRIVDDSDYNRISALPTSQRSDEVRPYQTSLFRRSLVLCSHSLVQFAKLWEGPKDDRKSLKLKVEFQLPDATKSNTDANRESTRRATPSVSENVESIRSRLSANSEGNTQDAQSVASPDAIFSELQTLRKKYDAVVEYTVHLTAERDAIVSQLDTANRELTKERSKKRSDSAGGAGGSTKGDKGGDKKIVEKGGIMFSIFLPLRSLGPAPTNGVPSRVLQGFSLFVVLFVALLCFLLGKYMS